MAFTELDIWNLALTRIGEDALEDRKARSKAGDLCRLQYGPTRDSLLRKHAWNFATERKKLGLVKMETGEKRDRGFKLPAECLRVVRAFNPSTGAEIDFRLEGREVKTDATTIKIEYIAKVSKEGLFDDAFVEALAWTLAANLAMGLSRDPKIAEMCAAQAQRATVEAIRVDLGEGTPRWLADADSPLVERALLKIGVDRLETMEEGWRAVSIANRALPGVIGLVMRQHSWNFRTLRSVLTTTAAEAAWEDDWPYKATAPTGIVRLVEVRNAYGEVLPYVYAAGVIRTRETSPVAEYIGTDNDTREALFDDAVTWKLASEIASMGDGRIRASDCLIAYERALSEARLADAQEQPMRPVPLSSWEIARL